MVTRYVPLVEYAWSPATVPAPFDSATAPLDDVRSPHEIIAMCVSFVPGSLNGTLTCTLVFGATRLGVAPAVPVSGGLFATLMVVFEVRGKLMPSLTDSVPVI